MLKHLGDVDAEASERCRHQGAKATAEVWRVDMGVRWMRRFNGCGGSMGVNARWMWTFAECAASLGVEARWMWAFAGCGVPPDVDVRRM